MLLLWVFGIVPLSYSCFSCPICREEFKLGDQGVEGIPRNRGVEQLIDQLNSMVVTTTATSSSQGRIGLAGSAIKQLTDLASSYIRVKKFREVISILDTILMQVEGFERIPPTVNKVKCLVELNKTDDAINLIQSTFSMIDSSKDSLKKDKKLEEYNSLVLELAKLCPQDHHHTSIALLHCSLSLVQSLGSKEKVERLDKIGAAMKKIASHLSEKKKFSEIKEAYPLMEAVLNEFYKIKDVDMKAKAEKIAWFLYHFGYVCYEAKDYLKAISTYNAGLATMKMIFSEEASKHMVLGVIYHNMGCAFEAEEQLDEAKTAFTWAIEVYNASTDGDKREKTLLSRSCVEMLDKVEEKLSTSL